MKLPPRSAVAFPAFDKADLGALQALNRGECMGHQQMRFIKWLIEDVCRTYDLSFRADSQRETDFAEGKRSVGLALVTALKLDLSKVKDQPPHGQPPSNKQ